MGKQFEDEVVLKKLTVLQTFTSATQTLQTDVLNEATSDAGVTVESVLIKDGAVTLADGAALSADIISEKTAAAGVTADGVLLKDGTVLAKDAITVVSADGAISIPNGNRTYFITKAGVAAMTIVAPTATTHDGIRLTFISTTAQAHTLDMASSGINGGSADIGTFGGAAGDGVTIVAYQAHWYEVPGSNANVSWA